MLRKTDDKLNGPFPAFTEYYRGKGILAKLIMPLTKRLRVLQAKSLMIPKHRHLDIGCGDGYFLKRSPCKYCWGIDLIYGDRLDDISHFPGNYFDYISMLAVLEHLNNSSYVFKEIHRVLKPEGELIFTTPKPKGEWLMRLYAGKEDVHHERYYDRDAVIALSSGLFHLETSTTFLWGFNQLFLLRKI